MGQKFSEIFQIYRRNQLVVDGVPVKVPYWAVDKLGLEKFCIENDIPRPEVYQTWSEPSEIDLNGLPNEFVIKPANLNSSKGVMVLERQENGIFYDHYNGGTASLHDVVVEQTRHLDWIKEHEPHRLPKYRVMAQERVVDLGGTGGPVTDYKFWMIGNSVEYIRANAGGDYDTIDICFYDSEFNDVPVHNAMFQLNQKDARPMIHPDVPVEWRKRMLEFASMVADKLGATFCRIDLYLTPNGIRLGEITPTPGSPFNGHYFKFTEDYDRALGDKWTDELKRFAEAKKATKQ